MGKYTSKENFVYFTPRKKGEVSHTEDELILSTMCEGTSLKNLIFESIFQRRTRIDSLTQALIVPSSIPDTFQENNMTLSC